MFIFKLISDFFYLIKCLVIKAAKDSYSPLSCLPNVCCGEGVEEGEDLGAGEHWFWSELARLRFDLQGKLGQRLGDIF